ncbi:MAG: hypothetical protein SOZ80_06900 [Prevotella sp.]|uniref:hypothetical protein n=1 Tax=Prevotella sp. TaxID=59823 RepID=UPI002A2B4EA8|nr:hypothetical protein [Prevotella sp.]MDD7317673.1 hypothetical protein [Prevotellaceae bacterium]MDY4020480.1 hypothetical protein [Prevotella sp.]
MNVGKNICNTLKTIRKKIADANGIEYEPAECGFKGDCAGTCPACEQEVRYLEKQLDLRRMMGKAVTIAGISTGIASLSSCCQRAPKGTEMPRGKMIINIDSAKCEDPNSTSSNASGWMLQGEAPAKIDSISQETPTSTTHDGVETVKGKVIAE